MTASASAYVLLLALFTSKLPLDLQKDLRTRPPQTLAEAITAIQAAIPNNNREITADY